MRTFAQKPKAAQQTRSAGFPKPHKTLFPQRNAPRPIHPGWRTIGNHAAQRLPQSPTDRLERGSPTGAMPRLADDLSRIPVHANAHANLQPKLTVGASGDKYEHEADRVADQVMRMAEPHLQRACACGGGCPKCRNDREGQEKLSARHVPVNQAAIAQNQFDDQQSESEPLKSDTRKCPEFVSLTAKGKDPELMVVKKRCRFRLGKCTTPRGTCGNTADSGMAYKGKVKTAAGCTGKLAFLQNVLSSDRVVTLADGTKQCIKVSSAHHDGGPPWKGCSVDITAAGTHAIESDDCPGRSLNDHPKGVSISDKFKLYLMWKANGKRGWKPIANVTWAWSGSVERKSGAKDTDECAARYNITSKSHKDGAGSGSEDWPKTSPKIKEVKPVPCTD